MHFGSFWVTVGASKPGSRAGARAHARARATAEQRPKLTFRRAWSGCRAAWGSGAGCGVPERATEVPRRRASSDRKDDPRAKAGGATSRPADSGSRVLLPAGTMARKNGAERARAEQRLRSRPLVRYTTFRAFGSSHHLCTFAHLLPPGLGLQLCSLPGSISPEAMPGRAGPEGLRKFHFHFHGDPISEQPGKAPGSLSPVPGFTIPCSGFHYPLFESYHSTPLLRACLLSSALGCPVQVITEAR